MSAHKTLSIYDYNKNKICDLFDSKVELFGQAYDIDVTKEWDGTHTLSFKIPYVLQNDVLSQDLGDARYGFAAFGLNQFGSAAHEMGGKNFRWMFMKSEYLIRYTCGKKNMWFIANKPRKTKSNKEIYGNVTCNGYETLLKTRNIYMAFDDTNGIGTIGYLIGQILRGTGWTFDAAGSDVLYERDHTTEKIRSLKNAEKRGALDLIMTVCNLFQARPIFDTDAMTVRIKSINNRTQVLEGEVGRNLISLSVDPDSTDIVTRLYVEGEYGDYGYVGIDDVIVNGEPYGLPFIVNFDYYREIGVFTQTHEDALATYLTNIKAKKAAIRANAALLIQKEDEINELIGQCKVAVYYKNESLTTPKYTYGDITSSEATLNVGDEVYILLDNGKYNKTTWTGSSQLSSAYGVAKFATPAAGKIGAAEVQAEAKNAAKAQLNQKISSTTSADKIAEYTAEIARLDAEIAALFNTANTGLYAMMYSLTNSSGLLYSYKQYSDINTQLNTDQDNIEADFIIAMGYMLRDGYWNNTNYTVGQKQYLYEDAVDMAARMGRPTISHSFSYIRTDEGPGMSAEDIEINAIFKIFDKELGINDSMFVKRVSYGVDKEDVGSIEVSNQDISLAWNDLGSLMSRMSQLADLIEQKNTLYDRAKAISSDNTILAERLNGQIDVARTKILSTVSNWYTDDNGNIVFLSADGSGAMMMSGAGFMIANSKNSNNEWNWRTFGTGSGFTADEIVAGFISAERIEAGSIAVNKLEANVGSSLVISNNPSITQINGQIAPVFDASQSYTKNQIVTKDGVMYVFTQDHSGAWDASHVEQTKMSAQIEVLPGKIEQTVSTNFASAFSTSTAYSVGDIVSYDGKMYRFKAAHVAGPWNADHVDQVNTTTAYLAKTTNYQTAESIALAANSYTDDHAYAKTSGITIASPGIDISGSQYVKIASGGYLDVRTGNFGIATNGDGDTEYVLWAGSTNPGDALFSVKNTGEIRSTSGTIGGWTLAANLLSSGSGTGYVALDSNTSDTYAIWAGAAAAASAPFSVSRTGAIKSTSGEIGGWTLSADTLKSGTGAGTVALNSKTSDTYAIWAGAATGSDAPFSVKRNGEMKSTSGQIGAWSIGANSLHSGADATYVELNSNASSAYAIWAGAATAANAPFSVTRAGAMKSTSGAVGGWTINTENLSVGSGTTTICLNADTTTADVKDYAMWVGAAKPFTTVNGTTTFAPFSVKRDGSVTLTKLSVAQENGTTTTINLSDKDSTYPMWKLSYATVKSISVDGDTLTISTTSGTTTFKKAATAHLVGNWGGGKFTVSADNDPEVISIVEEFSGSTGTGTTNWGNYSITTFDSNHKAHGLVTASRASAPIFGFNVDATSEYTSGYDSGYSVGNTAGYNQGHLDGVDSVTIYRVEQQGAASYSSSSGNYTVSALATASNGNTGSAPITFSGADAYNAGWTGSYNAIGLSATTSSASYGDTITIYATGKSTPSASSGNISSKKFTYTVPADRYNAGANSVTLTVGGWQNGANRVTASNGQYKDVTLPSFSTSGGTSFTNHKTTVNFTTASVSGPVKSVEVDATSEYNSGWTGSYNAVTLSATGTKNLTYGESVTIYPNAKASSGASAANITTISYKVTAPADRYQTGYNAGYNQGNLDGVASVTITKVEQQGAITYSGGNYSVPAKATASNGNTGAGTITFAGTSAYNAGWNACLAACGLPNGGAVRTGGTYYANLYVMGQSGPSRVGAGYVGVNSVNVSTK